MTKGDDQIDPALIMDDLTPAAVSTDIFSSRSIPDAERHQRLLNRAVELLTRTVREAAADRVTGSVAIEMDLRQGSAHSVRVRTSSAET